MKRRREPTFFFRRQRKHRVHVTFLTYFMFMYSIATFPFLIIKFQHRNGNCFAWQWIQKVNHFSQHPFNQDTQVLKHVRYYTVKSTEHEKVGDFIETVNISGSSSTSTFESKRACVGNFIKGFDNTRFLIIPSSTTVVEPLRRKQQDNVDSNAWHRAYEHIHALSDIIACCDDKDCENTNTTSPEKTNSSTSIVVHVAFEAFVRRLLQRYKHQQPIATNFTVYLAEQHSLRPIEAIEDLLNKIYTTTSTSPSLSTIESIWSLYQNDLKDQLHLLYQSQVLGDCPAKLDQRFFLRGIRLLQNWMNWSKHYSTLLYGHPPPVHLIVQLISSFNLSGTNMSSNLWSLYTSTIENDPFPHENLYWTSNVSQHHPRIQMDRIMLQLVSKSGLKWEHYQCTILQWAIRTFCKRTKPEGLVQLYGGVHILWRALQASVKVGHVADTVWLSRLIRAISISTDNEANALQEIALRMHHFESLLHSSDPESLRRMERYMWEQRLPFNSTTCKMLLTKFSRTNSRSHQKQVSIGRRAERFFYRTYEKLNGTHWHPDVECAYCVVEAYLPPSVAHHQQGTASNSTQYLLQLRMVDRFIRQFIQHFGLRNQHVQDESTLHDSQRNSFQIFARLLDVYTDVALLATNDYNIARNSIHVAQQADTLFRYFVIQHRDGKIDSKIERPNHHHLQQLRYIFHICSKTANSSDSTCARPATIRKHLQQTIDEYEYLLLNRIGEPTS